MRQLFQECDIEKGEDLLALFRQMEKIVERKCENFEKNPPKIKNVHEALFQIFKKNSRVAINENEAEKIKEVLDFHVKNQNPIPIVLLWAYSGQALSPLKFSQPKVNLPRLADIWGLLWWKMFNYKIKFFHKPGIRLILVDEKPLLKILGWNESELHQRSELIKNIASFLGLDFIYFVDLPAFEYVETDCCVSDDEVISIIVSLPFSEIPELQQRKVFDFLYLTRKKPISYLKKELGIFWDKAKNLREKMVKITEARKKTGWAEKIAGKFFIDACLTEKGRFSPDIWNFSFPQHGGSFLVSDWDQKFSLLIIPEFKLFEMKKQPIWINSHVFSIFDPELKNKEKLEYIFYWI